MNLAFPGGDVAISTESPQVSTTVNRAALPYRLSHGYCEASAAYFRTFREACMVGKVLRAHYRAIGDKFASVSLVNIDHEDGAEDAKNGGTGLTDEQLGEWQAC